MFYTFVGGFLAVSWTDFFQGTFMFFCLLLVPFLAMTSLGGLDSTLLMVQQKNSTALQVMQGMTALSMINLFAWGLGYFGQPHILVRFMAVRTLKDIPIARRICMGWMVLSLFGAICVGLVGIAYFPGYPLADHESIFIRFSSILFNPWIAGCILAAILSAIMCAIDSQMLASSSALTEDIYHAFIRQKASQKELVLVGRLSVGIIACVAIALAWKQGTAVLHLVAFAWAGLGSSFAAPVVMSLFWPRMTKEGAAAGIAVGLVTSLIWPAYLAEILPIYQIVPGIGLSLLAVVVTSLLTPVNPAYKTVFQQVKAACR
jgi:sodium/proline symporter